MGFLIYEHGLYNNDTTPMITIEELMSRARLPTIYVHSQAAIDELRGLLFLAGQEATVLPMDALPPTDIICNAHYIAVYPIGTYRWT